MVALYRASQDDSKLAALLEMVDARIVTPELDRFLPVMYGQTVSPLAHVSGKALVVLSEPRSLFDDCLRAYEDIEARAGEAGIDRLDGLYVRAQQLDFGAQQRLNYVSLIRAGGAVTAELKIEQPAIAGSDNRFMTRIQEVVGKRYACVFAIPDRGARESMELTFGDEGITFEESLTAAPENAGVIGERVRVAAADSADRAARQDAHAAIRERRADALNARSLEAGAAPGCRRCRRAHHLARTRDLCGRCPAAGRGGARCQPGRVLDRRPQRPHGRQPRAQPPQG